LEGWMRNRVGRRARAVPFFAVIACACGEGTPSGPARTANPVPSPTASPVTLSVPACGMGPPLVLAPADGATLEAVTVLSAELLEGPCIIAAFTFFSVVDADERVVFTGCDNDIPARVRWDTSKVPNGRYALRAQRACGCAPACGELSGPVWVTVRNP